MVQVLRCIGDQVSMRSMVPTAIGLGDLLGWWLSIVGVAILIMICCRLLGDDGASE